MSPTTRKLTFAQVTAVERIAAAAADLRVEILRSVPQAAQTYALVQLDALRDAAITAVGQEDRGAGAG